MSRQKLLFLVSVFIAVFTVLLVGFTKQALAANSFTASSVTLSNSRMSYKAGTTAGASGSSLITISNSNGFPDNNTNHLFPGDSICFTDAGQNGCIGSTTYTVASVIDGTHFDVTTPLTAAVDTSGYAISTQSGTWTIALTLADTIPVGGTLFASMSASTVVAPATTHDGIPDATGNIYSSGFDLNKVVTGSVSTAFVSGTCANGDWGAATVTYGTGGPANPHTISIPRNTSTCLAGSKITVTIGTSGTALIVNPAPLTGGAHTQGTADVYAVSIASRDSGSNYIDTAIPRVAPVEAVLISANVDESLSFVVAGLAASTTHCGISTSVTTTATSVPWGHLAAANTFYLAAQNLLVNTNAGSGYVVTIQENDQMGKNGNVCTGTAPSAGNFTFGSGTCIRDTTCNAGVCSESVAADWTDATNFPGLGYTEATVGATYLDAPFFVTQGGRTFSARQLADVQGVETAATIMSNAGSVSNSSIDVCYRIAVPGTQPSGYYYNIAKYTATATF